MMSITGQRKQRMTIPLALFCDECGAANPLQATECFACQQSLEQIKPAPRASTSIQPYYRGYRGTSSLNNHPASISSDLMTGSPAITPASDSDSDTLSPGSLLAKRYSIIKVVGQGGFGVVYQARDHKQRNKMVAIKQINISKLTPRQIIDATDSYNREVSLLSKLQHKHLPRIYSHFSDAEHWYLVMDFIKGKTLEEYQQQSPDGALPLKQVLTIGMQVCDVLQYLHTQKPAVIFRDVKPANLMWGDDGRVYLIDFGIARRFVPGQARDTGPLGSPGYAAPEQYGVVQTTPYTDIYGLGVTLQTLITGKEPLELQDDAGSGQVQMMHPQIHAPLQQLLDEMTEADTRKRPGSADQVWLRLKRIKQGKWGWIWNFLQGLLLGAVPALTFVIAYAIASAHAYGSLFFTLATMVFFCLLPIAGLVLFIIAISMLFSPRKRLLGLGMLTAMALFLMVVAHQWILPLLGFRF
jgi:tRNA A-37 threonylcarbamoyl transferase component Bud32